MSKLVAKNTNRDEPSMNLKKKRAASNYCLPTLLCFNREPSIVVISYRLDFLVERNPAARPKVGQYKVESSELFNCLPKDLVQVKQIL